MPAIRTAALGYLCAFVSFANAQIFLGTKLRTGIEPVPGVSDACNNTFSTELKCEAFIYSIAFSRYFPSPQELSSLCTSDCVQSLDFLRSQQQQLCSNDRLTVGKKSYPITATVDALLWTHNYICRKDRVTSQFCYPIFDAWGDGKSPESACTDCVLGTYQLSLNSSLRYSDTAAAQFSSLTSSCQATGYPLTKPEPGTLSHTLTATSSSTVPIRPIPSCHSTYTVVNGDDCHSISKAQNVSTANMLYLNNLQSGCANFAKPGAQLCMPHPCTVYTVQPDDNCWTISAAYGSFTKSQLVSWNIDISPGCNNLEMLVGNQICVSYPGEVPAAVSSIAASSTAVSAPTNVADRTNRQCSKYYTVQSGDTCAAVTQAQGIALKDFYFLNPIINSTTCNNLWLGVAYCVRPVGDVRDYPGYDGRSDNPCVGAESPAASCYATTYETGPAWTFPRVTLPVNSFTSTASSVQSITTIPPKSTSTIPTAASSTRTSTGPTAPGSTQSGQPADCNKWIQQKDGEYCAGMAQRAGISLSCLYQLNPALNSGGECQGMWPSYWYCSGTSSNACV